MVNDDDTREIDFEDEDLGDFPVLEALGRFDELFASPGDEPSNEPPAGLLVESLVDPFVRSPQAEEATEAWLAELVPAETPSDTPSDAPSDEDEIDQPPEEGDGGSEEAPAELGFLTTLLEAVVLFLGMVAIETLVARAPIGAHGVHPHPYWLLVVPLAATRGLAGALVASTIATALVAHAAYRTEAGRLIDVFTLETLREPLLFFSVSFVIGELRDSFMRRVGLQQVAIGELEQSLSLLATERDLLVQANNELKRRVVDSSAQFGNLMDTAQRIEDADVGRLYALALDMIVEHCGVSRCSVLAVSSDGQLDVAAQRGWDNAQLSQILADANEGGLVARALAEGVRINAFSSDQAPPSCGPLIVAALAGVDGVVCGIVCIDEIPIRQLNDTTVMTFYGIVDWIGARLRRRPEGQPRANSSAESSRAFALAPWLGTPDELGERIRVEDARCSRQGILSSLVAVQVQGLVDLDADTLSTLDDYMTATLSQDLRPTDGIYRFGYPGCYIVTLAGAEAGDAEIVCQRIVGRFAHAGAQSLPGVEVRVFSPNSSAPSLQLLIGRVADHFRASSAFALGSDCPIVIPDETSIGDSAQFVRRLKTEWSLALRNDLELFVLGVSRTSNDPRVGDGLELHMARACASLLRATDGVFRTGAARFSIVLPGSGCESAFGIMSRLLSALEDGASASTLDGLDGQVYALGGDYNEYTRLLNSVFDEPDKAASSVGEGLL